MGAGGMKSLHPVDRAWLAAEWKSYLARPEQGRWEYRFKQPDGRVAWVIAEIAPHFDDQGRLLGYIGAVTDITERKRMEDLLSRHGQILDQMRDAVILVGLDGVILTWNSGAERLFGYQEQEIIGRSHDFLLPGSEARISVRDMIAWVEKAGSIEEERKFQVKSGEVFLGLLSLSVLRDASGEAEGLIGFMLDITDRRQAEKVLEQARDELEERVEERTAKLRRIGAEQELILENAPIAIAFMRRSGIVRANSFFETMMGYSPGALAGRDIAEICPSQEDCDRYREAFYAASRRGQPLRAENLMKKKDGVLI